MLEKLEVAHRFEDGIIEYFGGIQLGRSGQTL